MKRPVRRLLFVYEDQTRRSFEVGKPIHVTLESNLDAVEVMAIANAQMGAHLVYYSLAKVIETQLD